MTTQNKQPVGEPSIVVDPTLIAPQWTSEETVVFHRDMFQVAQPAKKAPTRLVLMVAAGVFLLAAVALRLLLRH
jgi:hypothetical protein